MELPCIPTVAGSCNTSALAYLNSFRLAMIDALHPVLAVSSPHGAWLVECFVHVLEDDTGAWRNVTVAGQSQRDTFSAWWGSVASSRRQNSLFPPVLTKAVDGPWCVHSASSVAPKPIAQKCALCYVTYSAFR